MQQGSELKQIFWNQGRAQKNTEKTEDFGLEREFIHRFFEPRKTQKNTGKKTQIGTLGTVHLWNLWLKTQAEQYENSKIMEA